MANLTESPVYEPGIFQLEKTTPPLGGAPAFNGSNPSAGHANVQGLQLANRTAWLKQQLEAGGSATTLASDLANSTDPVKGAAKIGWDEETVADVLAYSKAVSNYTTLRSYVGVATVVRVLSSPLQGLFYYDPSDTTSPDNKGTIIVGTDGRRWKRYYTGGVSVKWFGAVGDGVVDDAQAYRDALAAADYVISPPGRYRLTSSTYDSVADWRHHVVVPAGKTLEFQSATIVTSTTFASRAVAFLVRGSRVNFIGIASFDENVATSNYIIPVGSGTSYDSSFPVGELTDLNVTRGFFQNAWLAVSVQMAATDSGDKFFSRVRVSNCESIARQGAASSGNFNFRSDGPWKISDVVVSDSIGRYGQTASSFNFVGINGFSLSNATSYLNAYAGTEMENGCQDGVVTNFRSVDDFWGIWIDDSRRITVNGVNHKTITETMVSPLLGTNSRYRAAVMITREGFTAQPAWKTEGIVINGIVSDFGRIQVSTYGSTPAGEFGRIEISGVVLYGDGTSRATGNTIVQIAGSAPDVLLSGFLVRGAPSRSIELSIPTGARYKLTDITCEKIGSESSVGLFTVGSGRLSILDTKVQSDSLSNSNIDAIEYRVNDVLQPDRRAGQRIYFAVSGSPEGILTAGPGSLALSASLGKLFVKETGTGNTGWVQK